MFIRIVKFFLALLIILVSINATARCRVLQNWVAYTTSDEMWVESDTVGVSVYVEYVGDQESVTRKKQSLTKQLKKLAAINWHVVNFSRGKDSSDLIRNVYSVEGRIKEQNISNLVSKMKKVSKPGTKFSLQSVNFQPSAKDIEKAKEQVRSKLYQAVQKELGRLNDKFPKQRFEMKSIKFSSNSQSGARRAKQPLMMSMADEHSSNAGAINASQKVTLTAYATLTQYKSFCASNDNAGKQLVQRHH